MKKYIFLVCFLFVCSYNLLADEKYTADEKNKLDKQDKLLYNIEFEIQRNADPATETIPPNIKQREIEFVKNIPSHHNSNSFKKLNDNSISSSANWKPRGPWNVGGRFLCIAFDSENENIINAGAASGGMWRSNDKGKSWVKTSDMLSVQSIYCLAQDKRKGKNNTWYYGTGEMLSTTDRSVMTRARTMNAGGGIWKSSDNGASWFPLESTLGGDPAFPDNPFQGVWNIVVDSKAPLGDVIYASCYGGIYKSENGGESWVLILGDEDNKPFSSYIIQAANGVFYAGISSITLTGEKPSEYGLFRSEDGEEWTAITPDGFEDLTRTIKIAASESNPNIVYFFAEKPTTGNDPYYFGSGYRLHSLWKYEDNNNGDELWENKSRNLPSGSNGAAALNTLGSYCMTISIAPNDEDLVIIGGTNVYVSTDGFSNPSNTTHIGGYFPNGGYAIDNLYCHPDIHAFAFTESNSKELYVANDGGIHMTDDYTLFQPDWVSLNNGLLGSQYYTVAIDHTQKEDPFIFGGLQDNSSQYTFVDDVKIPWTAVIGGDGMAAIVADNKDFILGSWYNGAIISFRFDEDSLPGNYIIQRPKQLPPSSFEFYTLCSLDPNDNSTLYMPAKSDLYRKTDLDKATRDTAYVNINWEIIASDIADNSITAVGVSKLPADRVYFGTSMGNIYRIDNSKAETPLVTNISKFSFPKDAYCSCIDVDPKNADNIIVVFSNYHVRSIFHSTDGGATFYETGGNLEAQPDGGGDGPGFRRVMKVYVGESPVYLAATTAGLFSTSELKGSSTMWVRESPELIGNVIVDWIDARQGEGYVVIATQGAGVFSGTYTSTGTDAKDEQPTFYLGECYPNPVNNTAKLEFSLTESSYIQLKLFDSDGRMLYVIADGLYNSGKTSINFDVMNLMSGIYFYTLESEENIITKRMIIVK